MATAEMKTETTTVVTGVTLELSEGEAVALADILAKIGGEPMKSRRRYVDSVYQALKDAGVKRKNGHRDTGDLHPNTFGLFFEEESA